MCVIELEFPLKSGTYYITHGGSNFLTNSHAGIDEKYAIDIVALNGLGVRAIGIRPQDLRSYEIFGHPVFSPCAGSIIDLEVALDDQLPSSIKRDFESSRDNRGNHVVIRCNSVEVSLSHFMKDSITVSLGEVVVTGQFLGAVGNTGNSDEPHLHIKAVNRLQPGSVQTGDAVPIRFDGRFLVRNSLVYSGLP